MADKLIERVSAFMEEIMKDYPELIDRAEISLDPQIDVSVDFYFKEGAGWGTRTE